MLFSCGRRNAFLVSYQKGFAFFFVCIISKKREIAMGKSLQVTNCSLTLVKEGPGINVCIISIAMGKSLQVTNDVL